MVIQEIQNIIISYAYNKYNVHEEYYFVKYRYSIFDMFNHYSISIELQQFINIAWTLCGSGGFDSDTLSRYLVERAIIDYIRLSYINCVGDKYYPDKVLCKLLKCYKPFTLNEAFSYIGHHFDPPHVWKTISKL